ncbi:hypothetical protein [Ruegeria arenilitoris]|uniref:hypothetical protein n=1 Tax=Ruegeria arenilitoris TaxID=1173585 RepID=UPI00147C0AE3|nr:hypothetical protein [Ruegeria arenilitoris]
MIKGIDLTLLFGPGVPVPAPAGVIEALQSVTIEENSGQTPSGFDLSFAVDRDSPLVTAFLLSGAIEPLPILRVALVATVSGQAIPLINGVVTSSDLSPGSGSEPATLTVRGTDLTAPMAHFDLAGIPYPAMPPEARVALILAKYAWLGIIPQVIPSLEGPPLPTDRIPRQKGNDLDYIRTLADEAGYTFFLKPGPAPATSIAYWGPELRFGAPQPAITIESGVPTNAESVSFSFNKDAVELPVVYIQEPFTKATVPIPIPGAIPFHKPMGAIPPLPPKVVRLKDTARLNPFEALARGFAHAARKSDPVTGTAQIDVTRYGRIVRARSVIGVRGASRAYDGLHYVSSVRHQLERGSYKQTLSLKRGGLLPTQATVPA